MSFTDRLIAARKKANLSQKDVAERTGWSRSRYAHYEQGDRYPKPRDLQILSKVLDVSIDHLILGSEQQPETIPIIFCNLLKWSEAGVKDLPSRDYRKIPVASKSLHKNSFALEMDNDSMTGDDKDSITLGSIIIVDPMVLDMYGKFIVARFPNSKEAYIGEYAEQYGKKYLVPINKKWEPVEIPEGTVIAGAVKIVIKNV